jgi:hypothetical protein
VLVPNPQTLAIIPNDDSQSSFAQKNTESLNPDFDLPLAHLLW